MKAYAKTDIGSKRSMNQDYMYCNTEPVGSFQCATQPRAMFCSA